MDITGKTALVTGAGSGIGRAIAAMFARHGARRVWLCDLDESGIAGTAELVEQGGAQAIRRRLDVTDHADFARVFAEAEAQGGLDIVCNNAGIVTGPPDFPDNDDAKTALMVAVALLQKS